MPQKKNPVRYITACSGQLLATYICETTLQDSLELLRGKSGRVFGQVSDMEQWHGAPWWLIVIHS
jgi:argininosuccinate lyase